MDQSFPPRPALFLRLMLKPKPSRFRQLFSNLWVTHPILKPLASLMAASISSNTQSVGGDPNAAQQASIAKHDNEHFSSTLCRVAAPMPGRFSVPVVIAL